MKNQIKIGAFLSYLNLGLTNVIGLVYTPFLLRALGQNDYGLYSLITLIIANLSSLDSGLGVAIIRSCASLNIVKDKQEIEKKIGNYIFVYCFLSIILLIVGIILYLKFDVLFGENIDASDLSKAKLLFIIALVNIMLSFPLSVYTTVVVAYEKFLYHKLISILKVVLNPVLMIPILLLGYKVVALICVVSFINIFFLVCDYLYCRYKLNLTTIIALPNKIFIAEIFDFSFFVFLKMVFDRIYWSIGQFFLASMHGTISVAIFALALQFRTYYMNASVALVGMFYARITSYINSDSISSNLSDLFIKVGRIQSYIIGILTAGFVLFGKTFIILWAGVEYQAVYNVTIIILVPYSLSLLGSLGGAILLINNNQKVLAFIYFLTSCIATISSWVLIKNLADIGAAISLAVSIVFSEILLNYYYKFRIGLHIARFWKNVFQIIFPIILYSFVFKLCLFNIQIDTYMRLALFVLLFLCLYLPVFYLSMNSYEKNSLKRILLKSSTLLKI